MSEMFPVLLVLDSFFDFLVHDLCFVSPVVVGSDCSHLDK